MHGLTTAAQVALIAIVLLGLAVCVWRWAYRPGAPRLVELERLNTELTQALAAKTAAEAAMARSEAEFRADFEWAAVGKVHYDPVTGRILRANRAHAVMLGYEPEDLVGRLGSDFTHPDDKNPEPYARMVGGQSGNYAREKRYLRRDGSPVWGRVSASLVREPGEGAPLLAVAVIEDVDDRYRAQLALEQTKVDLEQALAQRDLLLREVYHRVKNNLQVVDSLLLLQSRRLGDPAAKTALETVRRRVYALGLVHQQLMGSADLETFDISPFLQELSRHLLDGGESRGISLSVRAAPLRVGLDFATPLGLLVTELVACSMQRVFEGGRGAIEVVLERTDAGLLLTVADNASGEAPTSDDGAGALSASIVDGLLRQLRGRAEGSADGGHRTRIHLPLGEPS